MFFAGITAGCHRLWSHKSYKATWPLRLALMICNTIAFQGPIIHWSRDHRVHHKYDSNRDRLDSPKCLKIHRHGCRSLQRAARIFLLARRLAARQEASRRHRGWKENRHLRPPSRSNRAIPAEILYSSWAAFLLHPACGGPAAALERIVDRLIFRRRNSAVYSDIERHVVHQLGLPHLRLQAIRQGNDPNQQSRDGLPWLGRRWGRGKWILSCAFDLVSFAGGHNFHHSFPWDYKSAEIGSFEWALDLN